MTTGDDLAPDHGCVAQLANTPRPARYIDDTNFFPQADRFGLLTHWLKSLNEAARIAGCVLAAAPSSLQDAPLPPVQMRRSRRASIPRAAAELQAQQFRADRA
jgi:hypothetical protein